MRLDRKWSRVAAALALLVAVLALYGQVAHHEFVEHDTDLYLTGNPLILSGFSIQNVWDALLHFHVANWHPLTLVSHMLDVEMFGLVPTGHLLENAAWHLAVAYLVWAFFERIGLSSTFAFVGSLLFAVHPLRVESVAWVVERKDLLSAFFGLASLICWVDWRQRELTWKLIASLALYACSLMSKAMLVTLPVLLILLELWPLRRWTARPRRVWLAITSYAAMAVAVSILTLQAQLEFGAVISLDNWPVALRIENAAHSYVWYIVHIFWPTNLAIHYPLASGEVGVEQVCIDIAFLAGVTCVLWVSRHRVPGALLGWGWFVVTLLPVIGLIQAGTQARADRFTYVPSLGIVLMLCVLGERKVLPLLGPRLLACGAAFIALCLGVATWRQVSTWRTTETVALQALRSTQDNAVALELLGSYYTNTGRAQKAVPLLREAARLAPMNPNVLSNFGGALLRNGDLGEAESVLLRANRIAPRRWQVWSLLGGLYLAEQRYPEALTRLEEASKLEPLDPGIWLNRGRALEALGRLGEARASIERAAMLREGWPSAYLALARVLLRLGLPGEAKEPLERVLKQDPSNFEALRGLSSVAEAEGDLTRAWVAADAALKLRPADPLALADVAWLMAVSEAGPFAQPAKALELATEAVRIGGAQPILLDTYALAAAANGRFTTAIDAAQQALAGAAAGDSAWAARVAKRLAAYRVGKIDRGTRR